MTEVLRADVSLLPAMYTTPQWCESVFAALTGMMVHYSNLFTPPDLNEHRLVMGGDMDCVMSPRLDRRSDKTIPGSKAATTVRLLLHTCGGADVGRVLNPTARRFSFYSAAQKTFSRPDHILTDKGFLPSVQESDHHPTVVSDHAPHRLKLTLPARKAIYRAGGLNPLLLSDQKCPDLISSQIDFFLEMNPAPRMSSSSVWEALKAYLRGRVISHNAPIL